MTLRNLLGPTLFASLLAQPALASSDFNGTWSGSGTVDVSSQNSPARAVFSLTIQTTNESIKISGCADQMSGQPGSLTCLRSEYQVRNDGEIWQGRRKVGDMFADRLIIFSSTSQVSEQLTFELGNASTAKYQYHYSNMDGDSRNQKAMLKKDR